MHRALSDVPSQSISQRVAVAVGYAVNPLILPPALFGAVLWWSGASFSETARAVGIVFILMTLLPLASLWWMVRTGRSESLAKVTQRERTRLYGFGILCTTAAVAALSAFVKTAASFVFGLGVAIAGTAALLALANLRWKISIHAAAVTGFVAVPASLPLFIPDTAPVSAVIWLLPFIPLVMWARVRTGSHSVGEVAAGAALGGSAPVLMLWALSAGGF